MDNEQIIRKAYQIAEDKDSEGWLAACLRCKRRGCLVHFLRDGRVT